MEWKYSNRFLGRKPTRVYKYSWSNISGFFNDFFKLSGKELNISLAKVKHVKRFLNSWKHALTTILYAAFRGLRYLHF